MHVDVTVRGPVPHELVDSAREHVAALERVFRGPVTAARVVLTQERNPRIERPARAEGEIVLAGRPIRAHVSAPAMAAAVDQLVERLHDRLRDHVEQLVDHAQVPATVEPGAWRHGAWVAPRPPRPAGERLLIRHQSFIFESMSAAEAAAEMAALGHEFLLYRDGDTGADALLYRRDDGTLAVIEPCGTPSAPADRPVREPSRYSDPLELSTAIAEMDAVNHRFLYFTDAVSGRGCVLYVREDGHYGLIEPLSSSAPQRSNAERRRTHDDEAPDEALLESFPASDPSATWAGA